MLAWRLLLALCVLALIAGLAAGLWLLRRAQPGPFVRRFLLLLFTVEGLLALAWLASLESNWPALLKWLANINLEYTPGTLLAGAQLLLTGFAALTVGLLLRARGLAGRALLPVLAIAFLVLGLDELFEIHEYLGELLPAASWFGLHTWRVLYLALGAGLLLLLLAWQRQVRAGAAVSGSLLAGLALMGISGLAVEHVTLQAFCGPAPDTGVWLCEGPERWLVFEEIFEMAGATLVLGALLVLAQGRLPSRSWRRLTRLVPVAGAGLVSALVIYVWLLPAAELRLNATPLQVSWYDGDLVLAGVRVDGSPATPGDEVSVWLYWQARAAELPKNLHLSLHALERPGLARSLASAEAVDLGQYRIEGWLPGVTVRKRLTLRLPEALPTPGSPALMLRVWRGNWALREIRGIPVHHSQGQILGRDQALIGSIALPGVGPDTPPDTIVDARFGSSLALGGYTLPERVVAGDVLELALDWQALSTGGAPLTQFLHLLSVEDGSLAAGWDETPFGGRFPVPDWPTGYTLRDVWRVPLPATLAPGTYRLVYGLYEARTQERLALALNAVALADGLLPLGRLQVLPAAARDRPAAGQ